MRGLPALRRIGGADTEPIGQRHCAPCDKPYRYRNKAVIPFSVIKGEPVFGFYARHSHETVSFRDCLLCPEEFSEIALFTRDYLKRNKIPAYDEKNDKGVLKRILLKKSFSANETLFCAVINDNGAEELTDFFSALRQRGGVDVFAVNYSPKPTNVCLSKHTRVLSERSYITESVCGLTVRIGVNTFFQVNAPQAERLFLKAAEFARGQRNGLCVDLFCGAGALTMLLAKTFKKVIGVEISPESIQDARDDAKLNGIDGVSFICADANAFLSENDAPDCVITDPPRKGLGEQLTDTLKKSRIEKIVYISCEPATLARDIARLSPAYKLSDCAMFDCFAQTQHVECVCLLERRL